MVKGRASNNLFRIRREPEDAQVPKRTALRALLPYVQTHRIAIRPCYDLIHLAVLACMMVRAERQLSPPALRRRDPQAPFHMCSFSTYEGFKEGPSQYKEIRHGRCLF